MVIGGDSVVPTVSSGRLDGELLKIYPSAAILMVTEKLTSLFSGRRRVFGIYTTAATGHPRSFRLGSAAINRSLGIMTAMADTTYLFTGRRTVFGICCVQLLDSEVFVGE